MQKIRNRSNFFQKIFHIRYISKIFENSTAFLKKSATSGILPEFLKSLPLFWTFFQKSFSGRPGITISAISYAPIRQIRQNYSLPGLFPKSPLLALFLSNFFQKNFTSPLVLSQKHPEKVTPFLNFFKKLSSPPLIISFSPPKRCTVFKKN